MQLKELATYLIASQIRGDGELACEGIAIDSRKVQPGDLFICLPGHTVDGHDFAPQAADKGAAALVVERWLDDCPLPQLKVKDSRLAMAVLGNVFFGFPSRRLKVIGVPERTAKRQRLI
ncbi:hypothetical protein HMSSN036_44850 [Paenibacillus macerans]|nr:hypothetical protein HMSSN036_44850 [Paenibacillus macerans]